MVSKLKKNYYIFINEYTYPINKSHFRQIVTAVYQARTKGHLRVEVAPTFHIAFDITISYPFTTLAVHNSRKI